MTDRRLPDDVRSFLTRCVESYEEIEIALLLQRKRGESLTAAEVAEALHTTTDSATASLRRLWDTGVVALAGAGRSVRFHFEPRTQQLRETLGRLADVYEPLRLEIIRLMTANAIERVRSSAAKSLADGFLWGRRDDDG